jgi:hypothetical protein
MPALPGAPAAHLRVYEPLAAFPEEEQQRFTALRRGGEAPGRIASDREERGYALRAAVRRTLDLPDGPVLMETVDGLLYVCPLRTRLRALIAAGEFRAGMAPAVADAFLSPALSDQAESDLERWRRRAPTMKVAVVTCTYLVPLPWFVPFDAAERVLVTGAGERSMRFIAPMSAARRRTARALATLRRALPEAPTVAGLEQLGRWLEEFHPHSRVELDYAGLVDLLTDEDLREDVSVSDIAESLSALGEGRGAEAVAAYERVIARWRPLQQLETAS